MKTISIFWNVAIWFSRRRCTCISVHLVVVPWACIMADYFALRTRLVFSGKIMGEVALVRGGKEKRKKKGVRLLVTITTLYRIKGSNLGREQWTITWLCVWPSMEPHSAMFRGFSSCTKTQLCVVKPLNKKRWRFCVILSTWNSTTTTRISLVTVYYRWGSAERNGEVHVAVSVRDNS